MDSIASTFGRIELQARVARERIHLANALASLSRATFDNRYRHNGSCERLTSRYARKVKRHSRLLADAERKLASIS